jgi:hypothetical protein
MEIEFQTTKKDFTEFNKLYCKNGLQKRMPVVILLICFCAFAFGGLPFDWEKFLIGTSVSTIVIFGFYYFIPLFRATLNLNKALTNDKSGLEKKKLTITDEGLLTESTSKSTTWPWPSIVSVNSNEQFIYLFLADKRYLLFPKRCFSSESEWLNFMGLIQSKMIHISGIPKFPFNRIIKKPSYLIGLICLIPMFGAIAGIVFIINGISKYKDKWFVIMGAGGILFTICFWYIVFFSNTFGFPGLMVQASQRQLNSLMKAVEFYKIKNGVYPDSLAQINNDNSDIWMYDPLQPGRKANKSNEYNYQKVGNHYYLFSSGIDGIPNTKDDIYPQVAPSDSAKFGLIRKSY